MEYIRYCDICKEYNPNVNHVIRISDPKENKDINGHESCINELHNKLKLMHIEKLNVDKVISKLNLKED